LHADPIRSAVSVGPKTCARSRTLVRTGLAMKRRAGSSPTGMWATLLVLHQEFELFGRDSIPVLRMLFDDRLAAGPRVLRSLVRRPRRSRRPAAPASGPIPVPRLTRAMGPRAPWALPPSGLRMRLLR